MYGCCKVEGGWNVGAWIKIWCEGKLGASVIWGICVDCRRGWYSQEKGLLDWRMV